MRAQDFGRKMAADSSKALVEVASALVLGIGSLDASNCPHRRGFLRRVI